MSGQSTLLLLNTSRQKRLGDFFYCSSAASISKEGKRDDVAERSSSQLTLNTSTDDVALNDNGVPIDPIPEDDKQSSELETKSEDGDLATSDS